MESVVRTQLRTPQDEQTKQQIQLHRLYTSHQQPLYHQKHLCVLLSVTRMRPFLCRRR